MTTDEETENIQETSVWCMLNKLDEEIAYTDKIIRECEDTLKTELFDLSLGNVGCKSGTKKHIKYMKYQREYHMMKREIYTTLSKNIMNGLYISR